MEDEMMEEIPEIHPIEDDDPEMIDDNEIKDMSESIIFPSEEDDMDIIWIGEDPEFIMNLMWASR